MSIEELIYQHVVSFPEKTAVISGDEIVSYADLWKRILRTAAYFKEQGLNRGERIVLAASKNIDFVYTYLGAHLCGLICVPIDPETNSVRLKRIVESAQPAFIIGDLRNKEGYQITPFANIDSDKEYDVVFPKENDIADLLFTTGTTGLPKGVMLSYKNQLAAAENINTFIGNSIDDVELLALPISHSFGLGRLRCVLSKGATLVMLGSFASMKKFYAEIERCKVTGFGMVPASWAYIVKMSGERIGQYAEQLNYIEIGSAFMPIVEKKRLIRLLPHTRICMHYGLTEASRSAFISFHDDIDHLDSVGRPSPNTDISVFGESGMLLQNGEEGEICVKGDHVCSGYWEHTEEEFKKDFNGAYFKTGDWGYITYEGYVYLKSRKKELINVGGKKVSPIEVEEVLNTLEGVDESACIGVEDDVMGEVVKAFIVGSLTETDNEYIKRFLMGKLENYKVPVYIAHISELPKTPNGKIQRLLLKDL